MKRRQSNASNTGGKGAKRMREFGYKAVTVWLDAEEVRLIDEAADRAGLKRASYLRAVAVEKVGGRFTLR